MAILFVVDSHDPSTNGVVEWLRYYKKEVVKTVFANYTCSVNFSLSISNFDDGLGLEINGKQVDVESVWYRLDTGSINIPVNEHTRFRKVLSNNLVNEMQAIRRALFVQNRGCKWLSNYEFTQLYMVAVLCEANPITFCLIFDQVSGGEPKFYSQLNLVV